MNVQVSSLHNTLNYVYSLAENVFKALKVDKELKTSYGFFNGNYIKIKGKHEYQKYPIPIISIDNKGDIVFNIDGICFEFFIDKTILKKATLKILKDNYKLEIYGGNDCLIDFYNEEKSIEDTLNDIAASKEETIGIAIYLDSFDYFNIKDTFFHVYKTLGL